MSRQLRWRRRYFASGNEKPTVSRLHGIDYYSIQTVVPKNAVNKLIPRLKECGAEDILEIPISKIVA